MAVRTWTGAVGDFNWGTAGNWAEGVVPATGDAVTIRNSAINITLGLAQSAVTLASLIIDQTFTGFIGTSTSYLAIGATFVQIGGASGSPSAGTGSGRIMLNFGSVQATIVVLSSNRTGSDTGLEPIRLLGTNTSNSLYIQGGLVGVGTTNSSEAPVFASVSVTNSAGTVNIGSGATVTTGNVSLGTMNAKCGLVTLNQSDGTFLIQGSGTITTANVGGTATLSSSGTIGTLNVTMSGVADFSQSALPRTVTTCNLYNGATLSADNGSPLSITFTNGVRLQQCAISNVTIDLGQNFKLTPAA